MSFYILHVKSGYVLDVLRNDVILFKRQGGVNQLWTDKNGTIVSDNGGVKLGVNEGMVTVSHDNNQTWSFLPDGTVRNNETNTFLDIKGVTSESKCITHLASTCENQQFRQMYITKRN